MDSDTRCTTIVESANAMAHTPLFASLDRVELAKLAAELEEQHFAAGEYVVREGEPGRDFYVIKSGTVEIFTGERPRSGPRNFHASPAGFGEVALLLHSARTASVVACTDLTVWRLSGERFSALLRRERPIADSIERALALRVAAVSREAADFRSTGACLTEHALDSLSADARRLLLRVCRLPRWPAATLARLCEASGAALAFRELDQRKVLLPGEGDTYEVNPIFGRTDHTLDRSDCRWVETAVEHLIADREVASAIELSLGAEMADMAARVLAAHKSALVTRVPVDRLTSWLALAGRSSVAVREQLEQLRAEAEARPVAARPVSTVDAPGSNNGQPHPVLFRARIPSRRVFAILLAALLLALGWLVPEPSGLSRDALITLAAVLATVPLLGMNALPRSAVAVLLVAALVAPGIIRPSVALAGFASPIWLLIFALACVAAAIARSGLIYRLALLSLERLPPSYFVQSLLLSLMGLLVTAGITSGLARISIGVPAARGIAEAMAYEPRSRGSAALGLVTFLVFSQMETLFLTSSTGNLVLFDLMPEVARQQVHWTGWLIAGLAPHVLLLAVVSVAIALMFRPPTRARVDARSIQLQKQLLGPLTRQEILAIAALVVLVIGFATRGLHHVDGVWIAVGLLIALYLGGALDEDAIEHSVSVGLLVQLGVTLGLRGVFASVGIDTWLASFVRDVVPASLTSPYAFVLVIGVTAYVVHFFVPWMTASPILALMAMPIAAGLGIHPVVAVIVVLVAGNHTFFPHLNPGFLLMCSMSNEALFDEAQARPILWLESVGRLLALVASVPYWKMLGLA